MIQNTFILL